MATRALAHLEGHDDIMYPELVPFLLVHVACVAAIWSGVTRTAVVIGVTLYAVRMFAVTAGYHRYFSHRSYRAGRWFQFVLAFAAQTTTQKSVLWWAGKHRQHHRHSDTSADVHSPRHRGLLYAHVGWVFDRRHDRTELEGIADLARYPELRFLQRWEQLPAIMLALGAYLVGGWSGAVVGFCWSTVVLYHCTFAINSLAHSVGTRRYATGDDSRNNWWLALITFGEGWHNNHHAYQRSARQGFRWHEIDATFYLLIVLSWTGIVWDLRGPPAHIVRAGRSPAGARRPAPALERDVA